MSKSVPGHSPGLALAIAAGLAALPAQAQIGGFGGPAVLSRGTRPQSPERARPVFVSGHVWLGANYNKGLTFPGTDAGGRLTDDDTFGATVGWSVTGSRQGRRDSFFASYSGGYQLYQERYYSGTQQMLSLAYSRQIARRWTFYVAQSGSTSNTQFNDLTVASTDLPTAELPDASFEILDNRNVLLSSAAGFSFQKSARLTFNFSGGALFQRRHSAALASSNGFIGSGNMSYMLNRRSQIGVSYSYGTYYLTRDYGEMQVQSTSLSYGRVLSPRWFFNVSGGVYQVDSKRVIRVAVDPFIALLTGQTSTLSLFDGSRRGFTGSGALSGRFRRASVTMGYSRGIAPGNGIYFGTEQETATVSAGLNTESRFGLSFNAGWTRLRALTQEIGRGENIGAQVNTSYRLFSLLHARGAVGVSRWEIPASSFRRDRFYANVGISFGSPNIPLTLW